MGPLALGLLLGLRPVLSGPEITRDIQQFRVHYTLAGEDAPAQGAADVDAVEAGITRVITHWVGEVGMRAPLPDGGDGGDDRIDVYLRKLDARGRTHVEQVGQPQAASAWIELDPRTALVSPARLSAAAGHETFHAIQYAYSPSLAPWIHEASATYVEDTDFVDPALAKEVEAHYAGIFDYPEVPLDQIDGVHEYDAMVFVTFLVGGVPGLLRQTWESMAAEKDTLAGIADSAQQPVDLLLLNFALAHLDRVSLRGIGSKATFSMPGLSLLYLGIPGGAEGHTILVEVSGSPTWTSIPGSRGAQTIVVAAPPGSSSSVNVDVFDAYYDPPPPPPPARGCSAAPGSPNRALTIALLVSLLVVRRGRSRGGRARP